MYMGYETEASHAHEGHTLNGIAVSGQLAEVKSKLAHTVRKNARRHCALTPGQLLKVLAKDLPIDAQQALLAEMLQETVYSDIKSMITASGRLFLYSLTHMTTMEAEAKGHLEEVKHVIAEKIRRNSRVTTSLTPLGALYSLWTELKPVQVCSILNEMQTQACYRDLKTISACSGELYLYSERHITDKYAALLVRAAVNDACQMIVHTVREESRIIPRPTKIGTFTSHVFGIPATSLQPCIVRVLNKPEFSDIRKLVHPETEAVYLYSSMYMNEEHAHSVMKWLEEGSGLQPQGNHLG